MCVILDSNRGGDYVNDKDEAIRQVREYVEQGKLKLVFPWGRLLCEYEESYKVLRLFIIYGKEGFTKSIPDDECKKAEKELKKLKNENKDIFKSNDFDTLVLAKAAKVKLLVTEDENLEKDFKNPKIIGGKIYKDKDHKHLLDKNRCPN